MSIHDVDRTSDSYKSNKNITMVRGRIFENVVQAKLLLLKKLVCYYKYLEDGLSDGELAMLNVWGATKDQRTLSLVYQEPLKCAKDSRNINRSDWTNLIVTVDPKGATGLIYEIEGIEKFEAIEIDGIFDAGAVSITEGTDGNGEWKHDDLHGYVSDCHLVLTGVSIRYGFPMSINEINGFRLMPQIISKADSQFVDAIAVGHNVVLNSMPITLCRKDGHALAPMVVTEDNPFHTGYTVICNDCKYLVTPLILSCNKPFNLSTLIMADEEFFNIDSMALSSKGYYHPFPMVINREMLT